MRKENAKNNKKIAKTKKLAKIKKVCKKKGAEKKSLPQRNFVSKDSKKRKVCQKQQKKLQ